MVASNAYHNDGESESEEEREMVVTLEKKNNEGDVVVKLEKKKKGEKKEEEEEEEEEDDDEDNPWWCNAKLISVVIISTVILIGWIVLRPTKPKFVLLDATVFALDVSGTNFVTSEFQVTVRTSNPNGHIGIFYDRLIVYASFHDQQITFPTHIPTTYQERNRMNIWSPLVTGISIPIARFTWASLKQDQAAWILPILFEIDGWVKWKVPPFSTWSYHIHVKCQAYIPIANPNADVAFKNSIVKYQLYQSCSVGG